MSRTINCDANIICHLLPNEKAAIVELARARRLTVSKLIRYTLEREVIEAAKAANRTKRAVA
jgi:hypothetical protein